MKRNGVKVTNRTRVNPTDKIGDIPVIKYDVDGEISLLASGGGFVLCRRGDCYPMIRTEREWRAKRRAAGLGRGD